MVFGFISKSTDGAVCSLGVGSRLVRVGEEV